MKNRSAFKRTQRLCGICRERLIEKWLIGAPDLMHYKVAQREVAQLQWLHDNYGWEERTI